MREYGSFFEELWMAAMFFVCVFMDFLGEMFAQEQKADSSNILFVIKIDANIGPRTHRHLKQGLLEAEERGVGAVLLELNTFGGALNSADEMRQLLLSHPQPVHVFINKNAASAGALLSLACDSIYMSSGASIGSATVVSASGEVLADKYQSYMRALMRSTAETQGRSARMAEAMVDPDVEIDSLAPKGKVLALSTKDALARGFCEGRAETIEEVKALLEKGYGKSEGFVIAGYRPNRLEQYIRFFIHPSVSWVLILIIIYGLYTEARTPGVGVPGLMAIVAAVLYLTPYYMYGLAAHWELAALILGVGLIAVEIFLIPGFGLTGLLGMFLCLMSLFLVMVQNDWFDFSFVPSKDLMGALMAVFFAIFIGGVIITVGLWRFPTSALSKRIALHQTMDSEKGFVSVLKKNTSALVGKREWHIAHCVRAVGCL